MGNRDLRTVLLGFMRRPIAMIVAVVLPFAQTALHFAKIITLWRE